MTSTALPSDWLLSAVSGACALAVFNYTSRIKARNTELEARNAQLVGEKEKMVWEQQFYTNCAHNAARPAACDGTLGAMQDQVVTDAAVLCARSCNNSPTSNETAPPGPLFTRQLPVVEPVPAVGDSVCSGNSVTSALLRAAPSLIASSVMDTHSEAAAKDITRAPVMPKELRRSPLATRSNPGA